MNLEDLTTEELAALILEFEEHNKVTQFTPYTYQRKFFGAGSKYKRRFLMAANRVGKSYGFAIEMSMHLTGKYPEWWTGQRFRIPILAWAVGITTESTRKVLQKELLGSVVGRDESVMGTGSIPRDDVDLDTIERDGNTVKMVRVKHYTDGVFDGYSTLEFRSIQQGEATMMGAAVHFIWFDEIAPKDSEKFYSQACTRTATTDGHVVITGTPEGGTNELIRMFQEDDTGYLYLQNATWDDCDHLTEEIKKELLASIPEWQRDMRSKGLPVIGHGAVFRLTNSVFECGDVGINNWWNCLWALDIGKSNDPTVLTFTVHDVDKDVYYINEQIVFDDDRSPNAVADYILNSHAPNAPVIVPNDGNDGKDGSAGYGSLLRMKGCNVTAKSFYNPTFTKTSMIGTSNQSSIAIAPGLFYMNDYFISGKLKVNTRCITFFKEKNSYCIDEKGNYRGEDHSIDSARYAFMSILGNRGVPYGQCQKTVGDFNNGFTADSNETSHWADDSDSDW